MVIEDLDGRMYPRKSVQDTLPGVPNVNIAAAEGNFPRGPPLTLGFPSWGVLGHDLRVRRRLLLRLRLVLRLRHVLGLRRVLGLRHALRLRHVLGLRYAARWPPSVRQGVLLRLLCKGHPSAGVRAFFRPPMVRPVSTKLASNLLGSAWKEREGGFTYSCTCRSRRLPGSRLLAQMPLLSSHQKMFLHSSRALKSRGSRSTLHG